MSDECEVEGWMRVEGEGWVMSVKGLMRVEGEGCVTRVSVMGV